MEPWIRQDITCKLRSSLILPQNLTGRKPKPVGLQPIRLVPKREKREPLTGLQAAKYPDSLSKLLGLMELCDQPLGRESAGGSERSERAISRDGNPKAESLVLGTSQFFRVVLGFMAIWGGSRAMAICVDLGFYGYLGCARLFMAEFGWISGL